MINLPNKPYNLITTEDIASILAEVSMKINIIDKQFKIGDILNENKKDLGIGPKWRSRNEKYRK